MLLYIIYIICMNLYASNNPLIVSLSWNMWEICQTFILWLLKSFYIFHIFVIMLLTYRKTSMFITTAPSSVEPAERSVSLSRTIWNAVGSSVLKRPHVLLLHWRGDMSVTRVYGSVTAHSKDGGRYLGCEQTTNVLVWWARLFRQCLIFFLSHNQFCRHVITHQ